MIGIIHVQFLPQNCKFLHNTGTSWLIVVHFSYNLNLIDANMGDVKTSDLIQVNNIFVIIYKLHMQPCIQ